jgi:hypothetical protein
VSDGWHGILSSWDLVEFGSDEFFGFACDDGVACHIAFESSDGVLECFDSLDVLVFGVVVSDEEAEQAPADGGECCTDGVHYGLLGRFVRCDGRGRDGGEHGECGHPSGLSNGSDELADPCDRVQFVITPLVVFLDPAVRIICRSHDMLICLPGQVLWVLYCLPSTPFFTRVLISL